MNIKSSSLRLKFPRIILVQTVEMKEKLSLKWRVNILALRRQKSIIHCSKKSCEARNKEVIDIDCAGCFCVSIDH